MHHGIESISNLGQKNIVSGANYLKELRDLDKLKKPINSGNLRIPLSSVQSSFAECPFSGKKTNLVVTKLLKAN